MQYDAAITASALNTTLTSNTALSSSTVDAISTILNLSSATATLPVATSTGSNLSVNFDASGQIVAPKVTFFSDLGAAGTDVTVSIPSVVANSSAILFNTSANVTAVIGNSAAVTTNAAVEGADATRVVVSGSGNDTITITDNVNTFVDAGAGNDKITTAGGNDTVVLNGGNNTVSTGAGNDVIYAGNGIDKIDGGAGYDVVNVSNLANYNVSVSNGSVVLNSTTSGQATLTNVQFVASVNGTETLAIVENQSEATAIRLYEAVLGRDAEANGTQFWVGQVQAGVSTTSIANQFLSSAEYTAAHATPLSDAAFINSVYEGALGRSAYTDVEGLVHWAQLLVTGQTRADVAVSIVGSVEAQNHDTGVIVVTGQV
ncbi:DUF4214 domain-containing protein [Pseudomonas oryzihabitans]|uniref:DUF4214 domain-containing protein n=1 Tax=Pseudomonas oryzihabitans TaxID=47885 RepID=UPI002B1E3CDA|nr:DUF4214 domain-containing protein [Pseudomonas oryzihabitans]